VEDLYALRNKYKKEGSSMEMVVKLLLNGLYGKFGQRYENRDNWISIGGMSLEEINRYDDIEIVGNFARVVKTSEPASFCFPLWAAHITAYARIHLHKLMIKANPLYVDTDSLVTSEIMPVSSELGHLKLEGSIVHGFIIKPKMYAFYGDFGMKDGKPVYEKVKIKGLGMKMCYDNFINLMEDNKVEYPKFATFKEAVRRGYLPNEVFRTSKEFSLEDNKREWVGMFSAKKQHSRPVLLVDGFSVGELEKEGERFEVKKSQREMEALERSDVFDSIGCDVGKREFLENEIFMELQ
jgi:hypothetical protein